LEGKNFALKFSQWLKISYFYDSIFEEDLDKQAVSKLLWITHLG